MSDEKRQEILAKIKSSIKSHGYFVQFVDGSPSPRLAYTIGLHPAIGSELVFTGGAFFTLEDVKYAMAEFVRLLRGGAHPEGLTTTVDGLGGLALRPVEDSWCRELLLGVYNCLGLKQVKAFQIVPDEEHWTIDVPDMTEPWDPADPIWKWFGEASWDLPVSERSVAITNLDALKGYAVTEARRWEEDEWEIFSGAGPDVPKEDLRHVPLAVMIGFDPTLKRVLDLQIGMGVWREDTGDEWHVWPNRGEPEESGKPDS